MYQHPVVREIVAYSFIVHPIAAFILSLCLIIRKLNFHAPSKKLFTWNKTYKNSFDRKEKCNTSRRIVGGKIKHLDRCLRRSSSIWSIVVDLK